MGTHTPGPWHYLGDALTHRMFNIYRPGGYHGEEHVCTVNNLPTEALWKRDAERAEANARLIAAAPELLEVARWVLELNDRRLSDGEILADYCVSP
jgi:hypothetical protein